MPKDPRGFDSCDARIARRKPSTKVTLMIEAWSSGEVWIDSSSLAVPRLVPKANITAEAHKELDHALARAFARGDL